MALYRNLFKFQALTKTSTLCFLGKLCWLSQTLLGVITLYMIPYNRATHLLARKPKDSGYKIGRPANSFVGVRIQ